VPAERSEFPAHGRASGAIEEMAIRLERGNAVRPAQPQITSEVVQIPMFITWAIVLNSGSAEILTPRGLHHRPDDRVAQARLLQLHDICCIKPIIRGGRVDLINDQLLPDSGRMELEHIGIRERCS